MPDGAGCGRLPCVSPLDELLEPANSASEWAIGSPDALRNLPASDRNALARMTRAHARVAPPGSS
jgi:hypothetical protein